MLGLLDNTSDALHDYRESFKELKKVHSQDKETYQKRIKELKDKAVVQSNNQDLLMAEVKSNTDAVKELSEQVKKQSLKYSEVVHTGLKKRAVVIPSISQRKPDRADCIRIVTKPLDVDIKSSRDIRSAFNKKYPDVVIESCYATAGGSFYLEVECKEKAESLDKAWDKKLFGGNSGLRDAKADDLIGVIKNVECNGLTEAQIEESVRTGITTTQEGLPG